MTNTELVAELASAPTAAGLVRGEARQLTMHMSDPAWGIVAEETGGRLSRARAIGRTRTEEGEKNRTNLYRPNLRRGSVIFLFVLGWKLLLRQSSCGKSHNQKPNKSIKHTLCKLVRKMLGIMGRRMLSIIYRVFSFFSNWKNKIMKTQIRKMKRIEGRWLAGRATSTCLRGPIGPSTPGAQC